MTVKCYICDELRAYQDCHHSDDVSICHSCERYYQSKKGKKKISKLYHCDVYTLMLTSNMCDIYSLVEWGQALELGKYLILMPDITDDDWYNFKPSLFKNLVKQSKRSFLNEEEYVRDRVIRNHPNLPFSTYDQYVNYLDTYLP
jgi:hypothetical protein